MTLLELAMQYSHDPQYILGFIRGFEYFQRKEIMRHKKDIEVIQGDVDKIDEKYGPIIPLPEDVYVEV